MEVNDGGSGIHFESFLEEGALDYMNMVRDDFKINPLVFFVQMLEC